MFWKRLKREILWYARRLWPFAIGWLVAMMFAGAIVGLDRNPVEATGIIAAIGIYGIAAAALLFGEIVFAIISLYRGFSPKRAEDVRMPEESSLQFLGAKFLAYFLCLVIVTILVFVGTFPFTWDSLLPAFQNVKTEWLYILEAVVFLLIIIPFLYLVPSALYLCFCIRPKRKAVYFCTIIFGILSLIMLMPMLVFEIQLLIHSASTNMQGLWPTVIVMLLIYVLADVGGFAVIFRLFKNKETPTA